MAADRRREGRITRGGNSRRPSVGDPLQSLANALEPLADGVLVVDGQGRLVLANQRGRCLLGGAFAAERPLIEQPDALSLRYPEGGPIPVEETPLARALRGTAVADFVAALPGPDGPAAYVSVSAVPVRDESGAIVGACAILRDATELILLQNEVADLARDLAAVNAGMLGGVPMDLAAVRESLRLGGLPPPEATAGGEQSCQEPAAGSLPARSEREHLRAASRMLLAAQRALGETKRRYRRLGEAIPYGAWFARPDGSFAYLSDAFLELIGMTPEAARGQGWLDRVVPADRDGLLADWRRCVESGCFWDREFRVLGRDGAHHTVLSRGAPVFEADRLVCWAGIHLDISERKQLEAQLGRLAAIVESSVEAIFDTTLDGVIANWNPGAERLFGYRPEEAVGRHVSLLVPPGRAQELEQGMERVKRGERVGPIDTERVRKDGRSVDVSLSLAPIRDGEGRVGRVASVAADISARKRAEEALRESEERHRALFDYVDEGFCVIEVLFDEHERPIDYRFLEVNRAFERQTGIHDAVGKRMREIAPQHEQHWFDIYGKVALTGEPVRFENPDEQLGRVYDVYAFRVGKPEERNVAVLFNDVTHRKAGGA